MMRPLKLGFYDIGLECPECGETVVVSAEFLTVRQSATDEAVTLRLKIKTKRIEHKCGHARLDFTDVGEARVVDTHPALP
jgi:hypothetical protein